MIEKTETGSDKVRWIITRIAFPIVAIATGLLGLSSQLYSIATGTAGSSLDSWLFVVAPIMALSGGIGFLDISQTRKAKEWLTKREKTQTILQILYSGISVLALLIFVNEKFGNEAPEGHLIATSQGILQFASFLMAGWVVGFFFFWNVATEHAQQIEEQLAKVQVVASSLGGVVEALGEKAREIQESNRTLQGKVARAIEMHAQIMGRIQRLLKRLFRSSMTTLGLIAFSGFSSLLGILFPNLAFVVGGMLFLIISLIFIIRAGLF